MKKIHYFSLMFGAALAGFTSCSDDDQLTDTKVTQFPIIELVGGDLIEMNVGDTWTEPGYSATEGTEDITAKVVVGGQVDTSKGGFYEITYSAANKDNFSATAVRTVMVKNPNSLASAYWAASRYIDEVPITITDLGGGLYEIDDIMAGYYFAYYYPGYEPTYDFHLETVVRLNNDNTLTHVSSGSWYFSSKPTLAEGSYDPETGEVTWRTSNGLTVLLTK